MKQNCGVSDGRGDGADMVGGEEGGGDEEGGGGEARFQKKSASSTVMNVESFNMQSVVYVALQVLYLSDDEACTFVIEASP